MRIKVFQAATMKDAMAQVKDELGDDAVILHTKKIKKGGILGYGAKEIFEVTAALDEVTRRPPKKRPERLPTLAELQAEAAGGETKPKSAVPLPQGHAAALPQAASATLPQVASAALAQQVSVPVPAGPPAAPVPPLVQSAQPMQPMQPMQQPLPIESHQPMQQPRLSQSAAKSYRTAGTEAAVAEAARQARAAAPASPDDASAEPFVPSFPSGKVPEAPFQPLVPSAGEAPQASPARKARRRKTAQPKRRKVHAAEAKEAAGVEAEREASSSRRVKREEDEAASSQEKRREDESPSVKSEEERQRETIEELQNELAQMKAMLVQVVSKEKTPEDEMSLQQALKQQEVESDIIDDVVLQLPAEAILADKNTPLALDGLTKYLAANVQMADGLELKSRKRKIAALLGPTGVGKTTTLAKIAAQCVLEKGISTAFITADTYRISAVEQLKTYADILGLPIAIVYTPDELKEAIQKFRQKQLILIDTAGRSQHNRRQMAELKEFLAVNQNIEKYLVLSATTKNEDAKDIIDKFSVCKPDKVIFTKTDETKSLGIILNILRRKEMRLSYLTNGQSVPDDIVPAEAGKLAELFLR
ncbi:flagellar biosynthesis protein FlhF [Selenomonas sputigena]|uniref:flagellar biosynthesis protein FlhF n=1 Tax=Selenomonas sputigena TaxID=69823 RepID=UPI00222F970C|nr:flagellar biosynthesis protein FlhF [Selenomonas sputigena]UZD43181.1 flagellar biosynthesis protein FlhF [Selenomonas sputigena]